MLKDMCKKCAHPALGLFLLRVALGVIFIAHGWAKLQNMDGTIGFFSGLGIPAFFAYVVAWVEFLGGIAVLLGIWTHLAGSLLAVVMLVALYLKITGAFGAQASGLMGGYEIDFILLASALCVTFSGTGKYAMKGGCCGGASCENCETCK
jgi:uncharacterized membrane protein YphA (DoxX/SURF4 family)